MVDRGQYGRGSCIGGDDAPIGGQGGVGEVDGLAANSAGIGVEHHVQLACCRGYAGIDVDVAGCVQGGRGVAARRLGDAAGHGNITTHCRKRDVMGCTKRCNVADAEGPDLV